ncbi:hypothetical protein [Variovorax rhizosphaerae]|uniref:Chitin-binding type-3 domain-containing protein n=1 Tax=Variovorax rhizosphaerae TaxID=1836200 RepID=A0ABU8WM90_9BURK
MNRPSALFLALVGSGLGHVGPAQAQGNSLFTVQPAQRETRRNDPVATLPSTRSFMVINPNPAMVSDGSQSISIDLPSGAGRIALKQGFETLRDGTQVWRGNFSPRRTRSSSEAPTDEFNSVTIVRHGNNIAGSVRYNGQLYSIMPLAGGGHALVEVDLDKLPPDTNDALPPPPETVAAASTAAAPPCAPAWISAQVYDVAGKRASQNGQNYENKWWTQGDDPSLSGQWGVWSAGRGVRVGCSCSCSGACSGACSCTGAGAGACSSAARPSTSTTSRSGSVACTFLRMRPHMVIRRGVRHRRYAGQLERQELREQMVDPGR